MHEHASFTELLECIYESAEDPVNWTHCLKVVAKAINVDAMVLFSTSWHEPASIAASAGIGLSTVSEYTKSWSSQDPWMNSRKPAIYQAGAVYREEELVPEKDLLRSPFFNEWLRPMGLGRMLSANLEVDEFRRALIACNFSYDQGPARESQVKLLKKLVPHFRRALRLHEALTAAERYGDDLWKGIEQAPLGFVQLDENDRIINANAVARALLREGDPVCVNKQRVSCISAIHDKKLQEMLTACARTEWNHQRAVHLRKRDGTLVTVSICATASSESKLGPPRTRKVLCIADPSQSLKDGAEKLRWLFGFTNTEATVARLLTSGNSAKDIASVIGVSYETVRTHLKHMFAKAGVRGQVELVVAVLQSVTAAQTPSGYTMSGSGTPISTARVSSGKPTGK